MEFVHEGVTYNAADGNGNGDMQAFRHAEKGVDAKIHPISNDDSPRITGEKLRLEKEAFKRLQAENAAQILKQQRRDKADKAKAKRLIAQKKAKEEAMVALRAAVKANKTVT